MKPQTALVAFIAVTPGVAAVYFVASKRDGADAGREIASGKSGESSEAPRTSGLDRFVDRAIGSPRAGRPWITDLTTVDFDGDELRDVIACDARQNGVAWIRQTKPGSYVEQIIGQTIAGPARVSLADVDKDGDLDVLVAAMGLIPPSNEKHGSAGFRERDRLTNRLDRRSRGRAENRDLSRRVLRAHGAFQKLRWHGAHAFRFPVAHAAARLRSGFFR